MKYTKCSNYHYKMLSSTTYSKVYLKYEFPYLSEMFQCRRFNFHNSFKTGSFQGLAIQKSCFSSVGTVKSIKRSSDDALLTSSEVKVWKEFQVFADSGLLFFPPGNRLSLLPAFVPLQYLGPGSEEIDALYLLRGCISPSEIATIFFPYVPTYLVPFKEILKLIPFEVRDFFYHIKSMKGIGVFKAYPMLFTVQEHIKVGAVKLNPSLDFVRQHASFGQADKSMRRFSLENNPFYNGKLAVGDSTQDYNYAIRPSRANQTNVTSDDQSQSPPSEICENNNHKLHDSCIEPSQPSDGEILSILIRYLPRCPKRLIDNRDTSPLSLTIANKKEQTTNMGGEDLRYRMMPLVQWIRSFSSLDVEILDRIPKERVVNLLFQFNRIFQVGTQHNDNQHLFAQDFLLSINRDRKTDNKINISHQLCENPTVSVSESSITSQSEKPSDSSSSETSNREKRFHAALRDELIDMDDILSGSGENETLEKNECPIESNDEEETLISSTTKSTPSEDLLNNDDMTELISDSMWVMGQLDQLCVRRLPPSLAPQCLAAYDMSNTPNKELLDAILSFLLPPPSKYRKTSNRIQQGAPGNKISSYQNVSKTVMMQDGNIVVTHGVKGIDIFSKEAFRLPSPDGIPLWRWVPINCIYQSLTKNQKRQLRQYHGLVNFIRLHGKLLAISKDRQHVIWHDPTGITPPFVPHEEQFDVTSRAVLPPDFDNMADHELRISFSSSFNKSTKNAAFQDKVIPATRQELYLMDPHNSIFDRMVLSHEIALFLPEHAVRHSKLQSRLPLLLNLACNKKFWSYMPHSPFLTSWKKGRCYYIARGKVPIPPDADKSE